MPWRLGPRAAFASGLLAVTASFAATVGLRDLTVAESFEAPSPESSIDNTLTRDPEGCAGVRSTVWHPLSGLEYTGRLRITLPAQFGGAIAMFVGDSIPLDLEASTDDGRPVSLDHERLASALSVQVPPDFWLDDGSPWNAPRHISRVTIDARGHRDRHVVLSLGRRAPRVLARLIGYPPDVRVPVCAEPLALAETYFATGWYGQEFDGPTAVPTRWMREQGAVLMRSADGRGVRIRARVSPPDGGDDESTKLTVRVNDVFETDALPLRRGFADYEWSVPDAAWVPGTNEVLFSVSRTRRVGTRTLGLALRSLHAQ